MKNRVAYFGVFTSLALILSYVESLIPLPFGVPGMKLAVSYTHLTLPTICSV